MRVMSCIVGLDDGHVLPYYCIQHEGALWLVTAWLIENDTQVAVPERMIRLDSYQKAEPGSRFQYINVLLPRAVIEGLSQDTPGFEVRSLPNSPRIGRHLIKMLPTFP